MTQSAWRQQSREVILAVLEALPAGATLAEKHKAVSAAYPFGPRKMYPYKVWCSEVQAILDNRGRWSPTPCVVVDPGPLAGFDDYGPIVRCGWCHSAEGCLACTTTRQKLLRLRPEVDWVAWRKWLHDLESATKGDREHGRQLFADWLEETGWPEQGAIVRSGLWPVLLAKAKPRGKANQ